MLNRKVLFFTSSAPVQILLSEKQNATVIMHLLGIWENPVLLVAILKTNPALSFS